MNEIKLGKEYRDVITGFVGTAIAMTTWINGCVRITLCPKVDKDGKLPENACVDIEQLEETGNEIMIVASDTGGDREAPTLGITPSRPSNPTKF